MTRVRSEVAEREDRSGPFRRKVVQRWNTVKTVDSEKWDVFASPNSSQPISLLSGHPTTDSDNKSVWLAIEPTTRVVGGVISEVYMTRPVKSWLELRRPRIGKDQDADEVDKVMKGLKVIEQQERRKFDKFVGKVEEEEKIPKKRSDDRKPKKVSEEANDDDAVWEGDEDFSDDDDLLADDEEQQKEEVAVEGDEVPGDTKTSADVFARDIAAILAKDKEKEKIAMEEDTLDAELEGIDAGQEDSDSEMVAIPSLTSLMPNIPPQALPALRKPVSKAEDIKARIKDLFWRSEFSAKPAEILAIFPKIKKGSEDYSLLTSALKELADVRDDRLFLKPAFRK